MRRRVLALALPSSIALGLLVSPGPVLAQAALVRTPPPQTVPRQPVPAPTIPAVRKPTPQAVKPPGLPLGPPARPSGLRIAKKASVSQGASYNYVGLMWTDNALNETYYRVERWGGPGFEAGYREVARTAANVASFEDVGVDPRAETYWWRVAACNPFKCSDPIGISIQNDVSNKPVGGTTVITVPPDPAAVCKQQGGVWIGWGVNHCSHVLATLNTTGQMLVNPIVQGYAAYFAVVGGGAEMRSLPEDVVQALKQYYGEALLREVRYGSSNLTSSDNTAMTDAKKIYFPSGSGEVELLKSGTILAKDQSGKFLYREKVAWLLHELQHARQSVDLGGRENYAIRWFSELSGTTIEKLVTNPRSVSSRMLHDAMPMEADAKAKEALVNSL